MAPPPPPQQFIFPYTAMGKMRQFPWKWYWKNARMFRFMTYSVILCFPLFWKIDNLVHSPGNVEFWKKKRAARDHTHFDPPHE